MDRSAPRTARHKSWTPKMNRGAQRNNGSSKTAGSELPTLSAVLVGSVTCICTKYQITVSASAPVLEMCRALLQRGVNPGTPLQTFRQHPQGDFYPCLKIRFIGEGAKLRVASHGVGFEELPEGTGKLHVAAANSPRSEAKSGHRDQHAVRRSLKKKIRTYAKKPTKGD
jgi:hypothetical protein